MKLTIYILLLTAYFNLDAQITISEILYDQPSWDTDLQYFELHNYSDNPVNISSWSLSGDINLSSFPPVVLQPGEFYLFSNDALGLIGFGIVMAQWPPGVQISQDPILVLKNPNGIEVARIDFSEGSSWPEPTAGVAIELCDLTIDTNNGLNWALSDNTITGNNNVLSGTPMDQNTCSELQTSLLENTYANHFTIFPNPVRDRLQIRLEVGGRSGSMFSLYDMTGQIVRMEKMDDPSLHTVVVENLPSGLYFYKISDGADVIQDGKVVISAEGQ